MDFFFKRIKSKVERKFKVRKNIHIFLEKNWKTETKTVIIIKGEHDSISMNIAKKLKELQIRGRVQTTVLLRIYMEYSTEHLQSVDLKFKKKQKKTVSFCETTISINNK